MNNRLQTIINNIPGDSYQDKLDHLSNCHCCERHQINKPSLFVPWHETHFHNDQTIHACMCNCRHNARIICRQADGYIPPPVTRNNTPTSIIDH